MYTRPWISIIVLPLLYEKGHGQRTVQRRLDYDFLALLSHSLPSSSRSFFTSSSLWQGYLLHPEYLLHCNFQRNPVFGLPTLAVCVYMCVYIYIYIKKKTLAWRNFLSLKKSMAKLILNRRSRKAALRFKAEQYNYGLSNICPYPQIINGLDSMYRVAVGNIIFREWKMYLLKIFKTVIFRLSNGEYWTSGL